MKSKKHTSGGRHWSTCFLRTDNPLWALASEGVSILLNECTQGLYNGAADTDWPSADDESLCYKVDKIRTIRLAKPYYHQWFIPNNSLT